MKEVRNSTLQHEINSLARETFFLAISTNEKRKYDLITGTGVGGGRGGNYSLVATLVWERNNIQRIRPHLDIRRP